MTWWRGALSLAVAWIAALAPSAAPAMQHAFLVQNSGWMEPFYSDPRSQFKPLVAGVAREVVRPGDRVFVSAFNQKVVDFNESPRPLVVDDDGTGRVDAALIGLKVAVKNKAGDLADTDFTEAIAATIGQFKGAPGIVWIFTNNKNSPDKASRTLEIPGRNVAFYQLLHLDPSITRTIAFALPMAVQGKLYRASGMMVYALAYGAPASTQLAALVDSGRLASLFPSPPARLKPLDQEAVRIIPKLVTSSNSIEASRSRDGRVLVLDVKSAGIVPEIVVRATIQNLFYPYAIARSQLAASFFSSRDRYALALDPSRLDDLQPGEQRDVSIRLPLPVAQIPSPWSAAALSAMGKPVVIAATMQIALSGQQLTLSKEFRNSMATLFPGDPIADVFEAPDAVKASSTILPMLIRVDYPLLPLILVMLAILLIVVGVIAAFALAGRTARYRALVDGVDRAIAIKRFSTVPVRDVDGAVVGSVRRGFGGPSVAQVADGHQVVLKT